MSGWLTVLPMSQDHFDLTAQEFHDALSEALLNTPSVMVLLFHSIMPLFVERVA